MPCPKTGGYREGFLESGGDIANIGAEGADLTTKLVVVSCVIVVVVVVAAILKTFL